MRLELVSRVPQHRTKDSPMLFVHGLWHGAWCWDVHFLPYFAQRGYACFAPDLRGHGASPGREGLRWTSLDDYVADVVGVVETLDHPPILVGHSMGGLIVQKCLEVRPAPAAVLLASVPPTGLLATTLRFLARYPWAVLKSALTLSVYPLVSTPGRYRDLFLSAEVPERDVHRFHSQVQEDSFRALLDMLVPDLPHPQSARPTPMLVLGADDFIVRARQVRATARAHGVEAEIFPGMRHAMMLDHRWRRVAERMAEWLESRAL